MRSPRNAPHRTLLGKFAVFYIADAQVLAQAQQLVQELSEFRRPQ